MPKSSVHKSHKQSKHSSKDYSNSEEDVVKMNEKSNKDESFTGGHRESASGEKRKISYQSREGKDGKDLSGHGNENVVEDYVSSKRRKEKSDADIGRDRWIGGRDERGDDGERIVEKEIHKVESLKLVKEIRKSKENSSKGESLRTESRSRSKRHESGIVGERKEEIIASVVVEKEESKSKGESKRKSERDTSLHKECKESNDKDRRSEKEKNEGHASKSSDVEVKFVNLEIGKKQGTQSVDLVGERQSKRSQENNDLFCSDDLQNLELDKDKDRKLRKKREDHCEREKYYEESKESEVRRSSSRASHAKGSKYRDDKNKDGCHADKYQEDRHRDDRRKDEKYREEADNDNIYHNEKYWEDGERDSRRKYDRHREVVDRDSRRKDEKRHDKGERDSRRKDEKYHAEVDREIRKDNKYHEGQDHENGDKDVKRGGERYYEDGDGGEWRKGSSYRDDSDRDYRHKEQKYREDTERNVRYKDSEQGHGYDREKRPRDSKYGNEHCSRDHSDDNSKPKCYRGDAYSAAHHVRKSSAYDESLMQDDQAGKSRDDQGSRRTGEKNITSSGKMDSGSDRVKSTSRNVNADLTTGHNRRQSSPTFGFHVPSDNDRAGQQDETKYRDYNYEERSRHSINSSRDHAGPEKTPSQSFEKFSQKDDGARFRDSSTERHQKPSVHSSPLPLVDKSPSSSVERRLFSARRNVDVDESTLRSGGSQDWNDHPARDSRTNRELDTDFHPSEDLLKQADGDTLSVSSPFTRNSRFSSSSKSTPPPLHSLLSPSEDNGKKKPNMRHRRMGEPNIGRMQGNNSTWRGYPTWHAPMGNGFLPYPHAPPPVGFHPVMQPFHAPPMFGVRPFMELSHHPSPYHVPDANQYASSGRPMGWQSQLDDPCPPPSHGWDMGNALFGDEPHIFGVRSDWDLARNIFGGQGWETSGNLPPHEKNNRSIRSLDEALDSESIQPPPNEQSRAQEADGAEDVLHSVDSFEKKNEIESAVIGSGGSGGGGVARVLGKDDVPLCHLYLSKLNLSVGLAEPELFGKCLSLIDVYKTTVPDVDHSKILLVEDAKMDTLFASADDSVFKKSMSLYMRQKNNLWAEYGEEPKFGIKAVANSNPEDENMKDETENLCPTDQVQGMGDKTEALQHEIGQPADADVDLLQKHELEEIVEISDAPSGHVCMGPAGMKNEEPESVGVKYDPLLHSDVLSETSESANLSRIHPSPKSTH